MVRNDHALAGAFGQTWPSSPNPPWEVVVKARPTSQAALSMARNLQASELRLSAASARGAALRAAPSISRSAPP
eukprot:15458327-Alexandrium_andersonii.AAC.1